MTQVLPVFSACVNVLRRFSKCSQIFLLLHSLIDQKNLVKEGNKRGLNSQEALGVVGLTGHMCTIPWVAGQSPWGWVGSWDGWHMGMIPWKKEEEGKSEVYLGEGEDGLIWE